ncbi:MAG: benzoyl-CoA-dihydrodiol lyase, partial [Candidatus Eisenbacteria bacterium]|nr:benzoyl-CoA-dihydrodiol lyase [Candidatus Eisenbacteria bacterium]
LEIDAGQRVATLMMRGPSGEEPVEAAEMRARGADLWALRAFRELDDVLLHLRFNHPLIGMVTIKTEGDPEAVRRVDRAVWEAGSSDGFVREVRWHMKRVLQRLDITARSFFALIEPGSCFAGSLFELALACDRSYMLDDPDRPVSIGLSPLNFDGLPTHSGWSRLEARFYGEPQRLGEARGLEDLLGPEDALDAGLVTFTPDDIDWEDEVRIAIEERASLSPDALTGMEANLRLPGPETMATKIFGRLSAWQNWIFTRPNSTGEKGALSLYGKPARPEFDWRRT